MNEVPRKRWGCLLKVGIAIIVGFVLGDMMDPFSRPRIQRRGMQAKAMNNCKQIILALKQYSKDADSVNPDSLTKKFKSANQVFRELFKDGILVDERIFGSPESIFTPDNVIGNSPDFEEALMPGECHWMLLRDQTDASHHKTPLIIENSLNSGWPPNWDVSPPKGERKKGQAWLGREIIVGYNDGSVSLEKLRPDGTLDWHPESNLDPGIKSWLDSLTPEEIAKLSYWDIEEK